MEEDIYSYPPVDLSPLLGDQKYGVICRSEAEATHLLAALKVQYPDCCKYWRFPNVCWDGIEDFQEYFPHINKIGAMSMEYALSSWGEEHGYVMIEFASLIANELEDFDIPDAPLSFLLGGDTDG